ncbi:lamin tail domain-containing protein, partial [Patescibacteria group bacterium]|nr:lamin tail domain-containing protein [Patescibacteria group bacterium]
DLAEEFTPPVFTESIRLSEILPNPAGLDAEGEFIELENFGSEPADLSNFHLTAGRKKFTFPENSAIPAGGFLVLARAESGLTLLNSGGSISLAWPTGRSVAELSYEKIREGVAIAFDGSEFRETAIPTPAAANKIFAPEIHSSKTKKVRKNRNGDLSDAIQISEILANPVAEDSAAEWIEIWNSGLTAVNLGNWQLDDSAGGSNPFVISDSTILQHGEFKIFSRPLTKIALNNSGREAARLFDFEGRLISEINFESPPEGSALAFDGSEFRETVIPTPNAANEFDSQKIEGTIRFAGEEGFVIENSSGEFFVKFPEGSSVLLARALLREGEKWKIFVENSEGNFTFKNFAAAPKLLRSQLLSSTNSPPLKNQNPAWILALLIFAAVFFSLRFAKLGEVWDSQN